MRKTAKKKYLVITNEYLRKLRVIRKNLRELKGVEKDIKAYVLNIDGFDKVIQRGELLSRNKMFLKELEKINKTLGGRNKDETFERYADNRWKNYNI